MELGQKRQKLGMFIKGRAMGSPSSLLSQRPEGEHLDSIQESNKVSGVSGNFGNPSGLGQGRC